MSNQNNILSLLNGGLLYSEKRNYNLHQREAAAIFYFKDRLTAKFIGRTSQSSEIFV